MIRKNVMLIPALLYIVSLAFPYWVFIMHAPTYPERALMINVYADRLEGDLEEWGRVSRLVGVKVPPPVPELDLKVIPIVMVALASLSLVSNYKKKWLKIVCIAAWSSSIALVAWTQYRLYLLGHDLDPNAPLRHYVEPFTPPVIGWITVGGKITVYHWPHVGSSLFLAAIIITTIALLRQRREAKIKVHAGGKVEGTR